MHGRAQHAGIQHTGEPDIGSILCSAGDLLQRVQALWGSAHQFEVCHVAHNGLAIYHGGNTGTFGQRCVTHGACGVIHHVHNALANRELVQCPLRHFWTDPDMLQLALASLNQEEREFQTDPDRTYLTGLSLGGYGAWELLKANPHRFAAVAIASSGIFWSYAPDRWHDSATLPAEYARPLGRTPIWLFHGSDDTTVVERQSELMFDALKAENGHVRLWVFQGLKHDSWTRAYNEPELPRWLLAFHLNAQGQPVREMPLSPGSHPNARPTDAPVGPFAERLVIPLVPPEVKLTPAQLDALTGDYRDPATNVTYSVQRQGEALYLRNQQGEAQEILAESPTQFFYPSGGLARVLFDRDPQGHITALILHDDRFEEHLERKR